MSELQRKIQFSRDRGVYVFRWPSFIGRVKKLDHREGRHAGHLFTWLEGSNNGEWAVYVEGEWNPRLNFSKREAVNLAYSISISKKTKLEVTFE